jgi:uncharacterized protein with NRDE domain
MCLILFSLNNHPHYKLVIAANRDEFYSRPTQPAHWWTSLAQPSQTFCGGPGGGFSKEPPVAEGIQVLAGKDLQAGGTWMGITNQGKFAAITNYRGKKLPLKRDNPPSRGQLVTHFLQSDITPQQHFTTLQETGSQYNGFNLVFGTFGGNDHLYYYTNVNEANNPVPLEPGIYGLSNDVLDTPWPKVVSGKHHLTMESVKSRNHSPNRDRIEKELFELLSSTKMAHMCEIQDTGIGKMKEWLLSPLFIKTPTYGTRSSTVILVDHNNQVTFTERSFKPESECSFEFDIIN